MTIEILNGAHGAVDGERFRLGMRRVAASVHVVTTGGEAGEAGFTATAVTSVSDTPPTLLVCLNRNGHTAGVMRRNGVFAVNVLAASHQPVADIFSGRGGLSPAQRFAAGHWQRGWNSVPVLEDALVTFLCRVSHIQAVGSHDVAFGVVEAMNLGNAGGAPVAHVGSDRGALLYYDRAYRQL